MANRTWLELSQDLRRECGIQGSGPSAVTGQTGIYAFIVSAIAQAYIDIQSLHDNWKFLWTTGQFSTTTGTRDYTVPSDLKIINPASITATDSNGYLNKVTFLDYSLFRERYLLTDPDNDYTPSILTITPNNSFRFHEYTSASYTIDYEYTETADTFSASSDAPSWPEQFDQIIVFKAMVDYGLYYNAPESVERGNIRYQELLHALKEDQLIRPTLKLGSFLADGYVRTSRYL